MHNHPYIARDTDVASPRSVTIGRMGIRYYAYPVRADLIERARADPRLFISADPLMDAWGSEQARPRMLYLDKAWQVLQRLLDGRPASSLVAGNVGWSDEGPEPWVRVLDPYDVVDIARDLLRVEPVVEGSPVLDGPSGWGADAINRYLDDAQRFVSELADEDAGLVYIIG